MSDSREQKKHEKKKEEILNVWTHKKFEKKPIGINESSYAIIQQLLFYD